ncbi:MAG: hypothetical protein ACM31C_05955 [Acidobacteriota bacterium]
MKGDVALAGFVLTAEEWQALDPVTRAMLESAATRRDDGSVATPTTALGSEPNVALPPDNDE